MTPFVLGRGPALSFADNEFPRPTRVEPELLYAYATFSWVLARTLTPETRTLALSGVISQPEFVLGWRLAVNSFTDDHLLPILSTGPSPSRG